MKLLKAFPIIKMFIKFDAINKIIKKLIFIKAFVRKAIIKVSFKSDKSASLSRELIKKF